MKPRTKLWLQLLGIVALALAAAWISHPNGRINLSALKIPVNRQLPLKLGLDLQGGSHLVYQADFSHVEAADRGNALEAIRSTVERRVNSFGVAEPVVQVTGNDRVTVELPGIKDINEAIRQIGQTPLLEFKTEAAVDAKPNASGTVDVDPNLMWKSTGLSGKQLKRATVDLQGGQSLSSAVVVRLEFNDEGKDLFSQITTENVGKQIAIFLDGQPISAPVVQNPITDGVAVITGSFTVDQAKELATRLNSGALPVPIKLISQQNVGATLGKQSVEKSLLAGILGFILIAVFMLSFYRFPGLLAILALAVYVVVSVAVFKVGISFTAVVIVGGLFLLGLTVGPWFGAGALAAYIGLLFLGGLSPVTITLAGIAGFILSVGMAVDANILIFERVREEIRSGKEVSRALEDGFDRAWLSIRDSNVSSLITCTILYAFGTPSIRGFAVTLAIGIIISMFTAISVTRTFLRLFVTGKALQRTWLFGVKAAGEGR